MKRPLMRVRPLFPYLLLIIGLAALVLVACSGSDKTGDDQYTEFDQELLRRLEPDLPSSDRPQAFLSNRFQRDRTEFSEYIALFRDDRLGTRMRRELITYATVHPDPFLRANVLYLLVQAGFDNLHSEVLANLTHANDYLRYRSVLALPFVIDPRELDVLLPLLGEKEQAEDVRRAAQHVFNDLVGTEDIEAVFAALRASDNDLTRARFLATVIGRLLDALPTPQQEQILRAALAEFGRGSAATDAFLLLRLRGTFTGELAEPLARIVSDRAREPEQRKAAYVELLRLVQAGGRDAAAVTEQARNMRLALVAELQAETAQRVLTPREVQALLDPLGLDAATVGVLREQVAEAEIADWRRAETRDVVATVLLANHAPRSDWLTAKLVEGMRNPDIAPAASRALLRYALEVIDQPEQQRELVQTAARALNDGRRDVAATTAQGLAALGTDAAIDALLEGMHADNADVVELCADALLSLRDAPYVQAQRYHTLWAVIGERNRARYQPFHMIHALRLLQEIGDEDDLNWFATSCAVNATTGELRRAFEQADARIRERLAR